MTVYTPDDRTYNRNDYADVFTQSLLVIPSKVLYQPGDVITVNATLVPDALPCATGEPRFVWLLTPSSTGEPILNGSASPGSKKYSFSFQIPNPADDSYSLATSVACGGIVEKDTKSLSREKYVALQITVPDKSFKPGETVKIHWKLVSVGGATVPQVTTISVQLGMYPYYVAGAGRSYEVSGLEGDIEYTVPSSISGNADVQLTATSGTGGYASSVLYVRPSSGASPATAASNMATWGLVIGVLALFVAVLAMMRKPHTGGEKPSRFDDMKSEPGAKDDSKKDDKKSSDEQPKSL